MQESALWRGNKKFRDWFERYWLSKSDVSIIFFYYISWQVFIVGGRCSAWRKQPFSIGKLSINIGSECSCTCVFQTHLVSECNIKTT